jgi:hypothetical protein
MATKKELLEKRKEGFRERTFKFETSDRSKRDLHLLVHFMIQNDVPFNMPAEGYFDRIGFDLKAYFGEEDVEISILQDILKIKPWNSEEGTYDERQIAYAKWLYHKEFQTWFVSNTIANLRKWLIRPAAAIRKKIRTGAATKKITNNRLKNIDWM